MGEFETVGIVAGVAAFFAAVMHWSRRELPKQGGYKLDEIELIRALKQEKKPIPQRIKSAQARRPVRTSTPSGGERSSR